LAFEAKDLLIFETKAEDITGRRRCQEHGLEYYDSGHNAQYNIKQWCWYSNNALQGANGEGNVLMELMSAL